MNGADAVKHIAKAGNGTVKETGVLPDGSGFAVISFELPPDHWSRVDPDAFNVPPMGLRMGTDDPRRRELVDKVRQAGRYAYRCATMNGTDEDLDPDALIQNLVVGLFGYWTPDGLSADEWANPSPVPSAVERV